MRVLFLTQVVPNPPDAGPKVKTHYVIRTLAQEHEIDLITFTRSEEDVAAARELLNWCSSVTCVPIKRSRFLEPWYLARGWSSGQPFLVIRDERSAFRRAVQHRLERHQIDVIHADQLTMAQYLPEDRHSPLYTIFDAHNAVWELVASTATHQPTPLHRLAASIEGRLLKRFEGRTCRTVDLTLTVTDHDRHALQQAAGGPVPIEVVPIGVEARDQPVSQVRADANRLLSVATMHYPPNADSIRWFRDAIWPRLETSNGRTEVDIVGARPPDDLVRWGRLDPRVNVLGYVQDTTPYFDDAAMVIVPLRTGSGLRVKILEAMVRGVPVVSTTIGASGVHATPGEHLLIADSPTEFVRAINSLLDSPALRQRLASNARKFVLEHYDWRVCCRPVLAVYQQFSSNGTS